MSRRASAGVRAFLAAAIGTTEVVVNDKREKVNSYYYSPRGVTVPTEKVTQPYRFAGSYQDPTQLYHNAARYYDTRTGRFTQPDPSGLEANPYLYAFGDPTNVIDPTGLFGLTDALGAVGDAINVGHKLFTGDARGLWGDVAGLFAGAAVGGLCEGIMLGGAMPSGGVSLVGGQVICYAASWSAAEIASSLVGG